MLMHARVSPKLVVLILMLTSASHAWGALHLGLSGSVQTNNLGLETHREQSGKGSVAVDLGSYFRIGLSGMREFEHQEGYREFSEEGTLTAYESTVITDVISLDLIAILYSGELFTPFVFIGAAQKNYRVSIKAANGVDTEEHFTMPLVPNYGGGLAISLNRDFSLKITYTMSPGAKIDPETGEQKPVRDVRTDIGISYRI